MNKEECRVNRAESKIPKYDPVNVLKPMSPGAEKIKVGPSHVASTHAIHAVALVLMRILVKRAAIGKAIGR